MAIVDFTSSETFMENPAEPKACWLASIEIEGYVEGTYDLLRSGPSGNTIAWFNNGAWTLNDGTDRRFSDWAVNV